MNGVRSPTHNSRGTGTERLAVFSTLGRGSREEERILSLTAAFDRDVWTFDRSHKGRAALSLLRRARAERPDLIVVEGTSVAAGAVVLIARWRYAIPYVVSSGDAIGPFVALLSPRLRLIGHLYERLLCRCCAGFIGWTPYLAGRALTLGAPRAMTAANWAPPQVVDPSARDHTRRELSIPADALVFGLVGSLNWSKQAGYCYGLELVRAIARTDRADVRVLIVGDGDGLDRLREEAGRAGERVLLPGRVPRARIERYLAAMDVASLPQSVDSVGAFRYTTKLSEYLAAGLPIVTGQVPFAYDLAQRWAWRLPGDAPWSGRYVAALADLMERLGTAEISARRDLVPRSLAIFNEPDQRARATAFLTDVLDRVSAQAQR